MVGGCVDFRGYTPPRTPLLAPHRARRQEGVSALWTGLGPNIARNVAVSTSALASYDQIKETLIKMGALHTMP